MPSRRRVLSLIAGAVLTGRQAGAAEWHGRAFGAEAHLLIRAGRASDRVLDGLRARIASIEAALSLHADSELTRLNRGGHLRPGPELRLALDLCRRVHDATQGLFDPAIQPAWQALAQGLARPALRPMGGMQIRGGAVRLAPGQALTLNGMAQGLATDLLAHDLRGLGEVLVDLGEARAIGGDFRLLIADPQAGPLGHVTLRAGRAMATSSPRAMILASGDGHIIGPQGQAPLWSSVTVEAGSAALADAASTAFTMMDRPAMRRAARLLDLGPVRLVDARGDLTML